MSAEFQNRFNRILVESYNWRIDSINRSSETNAKRIDRHEVILEKINSDAKEMREILAEHTVSFVTIVDFVGRADEHFKKTDAKFVEIDLKFAQIDQNFRAIDRRFDQMDARFDKMDARMDKMDARMDRFEKRLDTIEINVAKILEIVSR